MNVIGNKYSYVNTIAGMPLAMDSLNYHYNKGTNQLAQVNDGVPATNYPNDIDNEPSKYNYKYNSIGQLAKDSAGGIDSIYWNIYGKVQEIIFNPANDSEVSLTFVYDPLGNRIEKVWAKTKYCTPPPCMVYFGEIIARYDTTKYSRDAEGSILAIYNRQRDSVWLNEWDIYGNKRVGVVDTNLFVGTLPYSCSCTPPANPIDSSTIGYLEGQKQYELTNHLGNVLVTLSDKKTGVDTASLGYAQYYLPVIINAQDYYPFGMVELGRQYTIFGGDTLYRYAFNGKLHDDDIYGKDIMYDFGARMYDSRLGGLPSPDPLATKAPYNSPYIYAGDNPIANMDAGGKSVIAYGDASKSAISNRLDVVFSGQIQALRNNFTYSAIGTATVVDHYGEDGKPVTKQVEVYGFIFTPTKDVKSLNEAFKLIRNSNLTDDQKVNAQSYAAAIENNDIVVVKSVTETTGFTSSNNLVTTSPEHASDAADEGMLHDSKLDATTQKQAQQRLSNTDDKSASNSAYVPAKSQSEVQVNQADNRGPAMVIGALFLSDLSDQNLDAAIHAYAQKIKPGVDKVTPTQPKK